MLAAWAEQSSKFFYSRARSEAKLARKLISDLLCFYINDPHGGLILPFRISKSHYFEAWGKYIPLNILLENRLTLASGVWDCIINL